MFDITIVSCYYVNNGIRMVINLATKATLTEIRKNVEDCRGMKVTLKTNKGKRKAKVNEGVIEFAYPSVFTVKINNGLDSERTVSYSYSDILTDTVEVTVCDSNLDIIDIS